MRKRPCLWVAAGLSAGILAAGHGVGGLLGTAAGVLALEIARWFFRRKERPLLTGIFLLFVFLGWGRCLLQQEFRERYLPESDYDIEGGYKCMNRLFDTNRTMPTAVMTINDFSAVGVMRSVKERGLRIPEDMAVVSFDNTFLVDTVMPRLTSVCYDYDLLGKTLVDTAVRLINGEEVPAVQRIPSRLVVRNSTVKTAPDPDWQSCKTSEI